MKILHIYKTYYPETIGGIESFISTLSDALKPHGVESKLAVTTKGKQRVENNVFYFPQNFWAASTPFSFSFFKNFISLTRDFDLIHYHFTWPFADFTHVFRKIKKPSVVTYHSDIIKQKYLNYLYAPLMHAFLKRVNRIVATSQNYVNSSAVLQRHHEKVSVIPFGMARTQFPTLPAKDLEKWRARFGENFFLFVGVLRYYKGLQYLLEAIEGTQLSLVIAGSGPEMDTLKSLAAEKKLSRVYFTGYVDDRDKAALYQLCHAVVAPAHLRSEAFCLSLLEGLLFEKPLISTEIGTGTSFVNQQDVSGIVVPPKDSQALRDAMKKLVHDKNYYLTIKNQVRTHYLEHFTVEKMANA